MKLLASLILWSFSSLSQALTWTDLWFTKDQQAGKFMQEQKYREAEAGFQSMDWKAAAAYRAKDYQKAASLFSRLDTETGYYNAGNALAQMQSFQKAIESYNKALRLNPQNRLAMENKKLVEDLLKKQQESSKKDKKSSSPEEKDQNSNKEADNNQGNSRQEGDKKPGSEQEQDKASSEKSKPGGEQDRLSDSRNQGADQNKEEKNPPSKGENPAEPTPSSQKAEKKSASLQSLAEKEKQEASDKLLRLIPEDPGGLLREKFLRDYQRRHHD